MLLALCVILTAKAVDNRFSGITSGEVPLWSFNNSAHTFALLGFSFYIHPLMMPMLAELPPGRVGLRIMSDSIKLVILGFSFAFISYIAVMGAAAFGRNTQGDIMLNRLLDARWARGAFAAAMLTYLSAGIPPLVLSLRSYLDFIIAGPRAPYRARRFHALTLGIVAFPLLLTWRNPRISQQAFAFTGATGVCVVCYVVPVLAHFQLMYRKKAPPDVQLEGSQSTIERPLLPGDAAGWHGAGQRELDRDEPVYVSPPGSVWGCLRYLLLPVAVLVQGCVLSVVAVYDTFS